MKKVASQIMLHRIITTGVAVIAFRRNTCFQFIWLPRLVKFVRRKNIKIMEAPVKWKPEYRRDHVYLHVLPRFMAGEVVNLSPFALKLELWMRINDIPFETVDYMGFSRKGQSPFIMYNEEEIPDSNFIVEFLCDKYNKDPFPGLNDSERAVGRAFLKMLEENTTWPIFVYRYVEHQDEYLQYFCPNVPLEQRSKQLAGIGEGVQKRAQAHGIGRQSSEEIQKIGVADVKAVSDFLADKPFMLGDTPSLLDCTVFGVLSQVVYVPMGFPQRKYILENCPNIVRLMNKLKATYWKNWDEQCKM